METINERGSCHLEDIVTSVDIVGWSGPWAFGAVDSVEPKCESTHVYGGRRYRPELIHVLLDILLRFLSPCHNAGLLAC